jgi:hypothetical protein
VSVSVSVSIKVVDRRPGAEAAAAAACCAGGTPAEEAAAAEERASMPPTRLKASVGATLLEDD